MSCLEYRKAFNDVWGSQAAYFSNEIIISSVILFYYLMVIKGNKLILTSDG